MNKCVDFGAVNIKQYNHRDIGGGLKTGVRRTVWNNYVLLYNRFHQMHCCLQLLLVLIHFAYQSKKEVTELKVYS